MWSRAASLLTLWIVGWTNVGLAQCDFGLTRSDSLKGRILIFDIAPATEGSVANRVFSFDGSDPDPSLQQLRTALLRGIAGNGVENLLNCIRKQADTLVKRSSNRWFGRKGDTLNVIVLGPVGRHPKFDFKEQARQTRLTTDLATLVQVAQKMGEIKALIPAPVQPAVVLTYRPYLLTKPRGNLTVAVSLKAPKPSKSPEPAKAPSPTESAKRSKPSDAKPQPRPADEPAVSAEDEEEETPERLTTSLVTGPQEHFFLSANAAFTQVRQVKYDEKSRTLEPDKKPKEFLLGVNYAIGDLFAEDDATGLRSFLNGVFLSLLLEGSNKPFNQIAASLGFRRNLPLLDQFLTLNTVSPYVGVVWARNDLVSDSGASSTVKSKYGKGKLITGLSLNLDKALGWLGGGKKEGGDSAEAEKE
jgi:hypothetical protein